MSYLNEHQSALILIYTLIVHLVCAPHIVIYNSNHLTTAADPQQCVCVCMCVEVSQSNLSLNYNINVVLSFVSVYNILWMSRGFSSAGTGVDMLLHACFSIE